MRSTSAPPGARSPRRSLVRDSLCFFLLWVSPHSHCLAGILARATVVTGPTLMTEAAGMREFTAQNTSKSKAFKDVESRCVVKYVVLDGVSVSFSSCVFSGSSRCSTIACFPRPKWKRTSASALCRSSELPSVLFPFHLEAPFRVSDRRSFSNELYRVQGTSAVDQESLPGQV